MKREIKFRGKEFETGQWIEGSLTTYPKHYPNIILVEDAEPIPRETTYVVFPETVGQFTGLCDKNGKEIYEGDIINVNGKHPRLVKFIDEYACFCVARISDLDNNLETGYWQQVIPGWWNNPNREIEVCGNIYDNPDLLKGDK